MTRRPLALLPLLLLAGCSLAPHYVRPATPLTTAFKEEPGWQPAAPADDIAKGEWWRLFGDPVLDGLEARVAITNQNVLAAAAAYGQARETVREARAALFPQIDLSGSGTRAGSFGSAQPTIIGGTGSTTGVGTGGTVGNTGSGVGTGTGTGTGTTGTSTGTTTTVTSGGGTRRYSLSLGATWEPDLFGRIAGGVRQQKALAEASAADLRNATLAAQGELAADYLQLRGLDQQKAILDDTIKAYSRALTITNNRYTQGVVARVDVLQAETQLASARASAADLDRQRAAFEHAIAVLTGENPSRFQLVAISSWNSNTPDVPGILPSVLLERRPDVAAAERRVAAANQTIGIERAAFFPTFTLSGSVGANSSTLGALFDASSSIWSLGLRTALTVLDFGGRAARVRQARFAYDQAVANYRQTVLTGIGQVEDQLAATRVLGFVGQQRTEAAAAATRVEQLTQNQYLAGTIAYTDVITTQTTALNARQQEAAAIVNRQLAAVSLIQAIGGAWPAVPGPAGAPGTP